ncbi:carbohydrate esterase family 16 protein [Crucibulum laeve]|uniref:Carbohydrate esterase family 16 protein n=1 Tax=Crucibulum laeve TaxID=68775 RepID=A0A5C3LQT0_9AGAR|nr:carbohydrate esterase family 16 protein [Crucibulum laeve]
MSPLSVLASCALLVLSPVAQAAGVRPGQIKNFVTFGDSYTDVMSSNGGTAWPIYAAGYAHVNLFPFARSGATCSNNITFRPFPPVFESQLPLYVSEKNNGSLKLGAQETIYSLWIGTNDVGSNALLTGSDKASLVNVTECMVNWVTFLYETGARNFIFQNMIPLETVPLYAPVSYPNRFWTAQRNDTEWSVLMKELVLSGNALTKLMLQALAPTLHGAHIALFDSHALFADMFARPAVYLNGTAPLNTTGAVQACVFDLNESTSAGGRCTIAQGTDRDSFLWFDELHPSEQADRVVAKEISKVINGKTSKWATWLS